MSLFHIADILREIINIKVEFSVMNRFRPPLSLAMVFCVDRAIMKPCEKYVPRYITHCVYSRLYIHPVLTRLKIKLAKMLNKPSFVIYYWSHIKPKHRNNCEASVSLGLCRYPSENLRFTVKRKWRGERQKQSCTERWTERERRWSEISREEEKGRGKGHV